MRSAICPTLVTALLAGTAMAGCGGSGGTGNAKDRPTATPTPTGTAQAEPPKAPKGIDVAALNRARAELASTCREREKGAGGDSTLRSLRSVAHTFQTAFDANPDEPFKRSPTAPPVTARGIVRAAGFVAHHQCGGGRAVRIGTRLQRLAARDADENG